MSAARLPALALGVAALLAASVVALATQPAKDASALPDAAGPPDERPGGATTVWATGQNAFSFPAANLPDEERTRFAVGNSFFKRNWVEAPASTQARDGLGPHFIARSCGGCHALDGRGAPPDFSRGLVSQPVALLMRLSVPGTGPHGGPNPEPVYGDQLNNAAVQGVRAEGEVTLRWTPVPGRFADGTRYTLRRPVYGFARLGYGPMDPRVMVSPRIAPQLIGVGLLEAIPEAEILRNAADQAAAPGPVKGQPNRVWDAMAQREMIGRFGWKANVATIAHQTAGAFLGDMGITSPLFPDEACTAAQADCRAAPRGGHGGKGRAPGRANGQAPDGANRQAPDGAVGKPLDGAAAQGTEIDEQTLSDVVFYQSVLAPPARRAPRDERVLQGQRLFAQAQCAACHRPSYVTGDSPFPSLASKVLGGQTIWPYTDLLLHDMGDALADGRPDFQANGRQWKTPPLWGIGLFKDVNGHTRLLHDGRANGVLEAVLWHGGEAEPSRRKVLGMTRSEREALVRFVESL